MNFEIHPKENYIGNFRAVKATKKIQNLEMLKFQGN